MRRSILFCVWAGRLPTVCSTAHATTFTFNTNPFAGSTALTTPGRQVVVGEGVTSPFSIRPRIFFRWGRLPLRRQFPINFVNTVASGIPASGVNTIVLQTFDNDGNTMTPFAAGNAADLIAAQITTPGPGFFIYFNQGLDCPAWCFRRI